MTGEEHIQSEAKAALIHKLDQLGYKPLPEPVSKDRIRFVADNGDTREIILYFLNLDKARSVSITVYMNDINPVHYLVPSMIFTTPDNIFLVNEQPGTLRHFSTWQIKVFTKAIETLSHYTLDAVNEL